MMEMPAGLEVLVKLLAAVVFGGVVGWQREVRERPAGLRTHVLVCVGACVYTLASLGLQEHGADPARVAAQVATGMGFLGAGTIIRHGNVVRGLTTAASLWAVAAVGLCVGIGGQAYWVAAMATVVVLLTLTVLRKVEFRVGAHGTHAACVFRLEAGRQPLEELYAELRRHGIVVDSLDVTRVEPGDVQETRLSLRLPPNADLPTICAALSRLPGFIGFQCE